MSERIQSFDNSIREVTVKNEEGFSLVIKGRDSLIFYNEKGKELILNEKLEPLKGKFKSKEMSKEEQEEFRILHQKDIEKFYLNGLVLFNHLNKER